MKLTMFLTDVSSKLSFLLLFALVAGSVQQDTTTCPEQHGPYEVTKRSYRVTKLHWSNRRADVVFPSQLLSEDNTDTFPFLVFAHGFLGGNLFTYRKYKALLDGLASFGFIVAAPRSCNFGCPGFGRWNTYYEEQLKLIEWADEMRLEGHEVLQFIDREAGFGVLGHSTGGVATLDALEFADQYDITAGVLLHPAPTDTFPPTDTDTPPDLTVPTAIFTGTTDGCCGAATSKPIFDAIVSAPAKAYANMIDAGHAEPNNSNTRWPRYIAEWFKVHLNRDESYRDFVFGNGTTSLCGTCNPMDEYCEAIEQ
jgi:dienelactone hydrolase